MSKAIEILEEKIKEQENLIGSLRRKLRDKKHDNWYEHREIKEKVISKQVVGYDKLPLPRLEMQINPLSDDWCSVEFIYGIVYKHYTDDITFIPFGSTHSSGNKPRFRKPLHLIDNSDKFPFRDGLHIRTEMRLFNLRGFLICDGQIEEIDNGDEIYSAELFEKAMKTMKRK